MDNLTKLMAVILVGAVNYYFFGLRTRAQRKALLKEDKPAKEITLSAFVNKNAKIMTAVGVFVGLSGFSTNLQIRPLGYIVSFLSLLAAITLFVELYKVSLLGFKTPLLSWFLQLLFVLMVALIVYWLVQFRNIVEPAIGLLVIAVIGFLIFYLIWSCPLLKSFFQGQAEDHFLTPGWAKWLGLLGLTILLFLLRDPIESTLKKCLDLLTTSVQSL